jgi:hypothetical protein
MYACITHSHYSQYDGRSAGDDGDRLADNDNDNGRTTSNSKSKKSSSGSGSSSRPKSASRRKRSVEQNDNSSGIEFKVDDEYYPTARGLVRK